MSPKRLLIPLLAIVVGWLSHVHASAAAAIAVGPYTPSTTMPFVVPIRITGASGLTSWTFDLAYDASDITINTACDPFADPFCGLLGGPVTEGPFFAGVALFPTLFVPGFILLDASLAQAGRLLGVFGAWQDSSPGVSGDGVLAYVQFVTRDGGSGTTRITVSGPSIVAEPETLALGIVGLIAMIAKRRRNERHPAIALR